MPAARAAQAAAAQGKFWEMHDLLFARQSEWAGLK
jgi:protein-disulfide isomerase